MSQASLVSVGLHFLALTLFQLLVMRRASLILGKDYGDFAHLYASASIALAFTLLGLHGTLMRYLAIYAAKDSRRAAWRVVASCAKLRSSLLLLAATGLWLYLTYGTTSVVPSVVFHVCLFFILQGGLLLQHAALQGLGLYRQLAVGSFCLLLGMVAPADDLATVFRTLSVGYGCSFAINGIFLYFYFAQRPENEPPTEIQVDGLRLTKFSLLLSLAGLCIVAADNSAIILLKDSYPPAVYSYLALALNLSLYPSRINALGEAVILPQISATLHSQGPAQTHFLFSAWVKVFRLAGPLVMLPLALMIGPFIRVFFAEELSPSIFLASILILGNIARIMIPASLSVVIAKGRPGMLALSNAIKLAIDLSVIFLLASQPPVVLVSALVVSWVVYVNLLYVMAQRELSIPAKWDWPTLLTVSGTVLSVLAGYHMILFPVIWVGLVLYFAIRAKALLTSVT